MSTYIGTVEIRSSEVLASIGEELQTEQKHNEPHGAFARRLNSMFRSPEAASDIARRCVAKHVEDRAKLQGPVTGAQIKTSPNVEKPRAQKGEISDVVEGSQNVPVALAVETLCKALQEDPDFAHGWYCNIVMPITDVSDVPQETAQKIASHLMSHLFGVSIVEPHFNPTNGPEEEEKDDENITRIKGNCKRLGWTDIHGGPEEGGLYWRGKNPETGKVEQIPQNVINGGEENEVIEDLPPAFTTPYEQGIVAAREDFAASSKTKKGKRGGCTANPFETDSIDASEWERGYLDWTE